MNKQIDYRVTAVTLLVYVLILSVCSNALAVAFEFPDILRESAEYRLTLFMQNSGVIVPLYYFLALTGLIQIVMAVMLYQSFGEKNSLAVMTAVFGILTGIFQVLGFIRWPIVVPYLADAMHSGVPMETIAFVEGMLNRYAGMAIGEHLGFLAQAVWTMLLGVMMLRHKLFDGRLGIIGLVLGGLTLLFGMEPLGGFWAPLGELTWPVLAAWIVWLVVLAISLWRTNAKAPEGMHVGWKTAVVSTLFWAVAVVPAYLG